MSSRILEAKNMSSRPLHHCWWWAVFCATGTCFQRTWSKRVSSLHRRTTCRRSQSMRLTTRRYWRRPWRRWQLLSAAPTSPWPNQSKSSNENYAISTAWTCWVSSQYFSYSLVRNLAAYRKYQQMFISHHWLVWWWIFADHSFQFIVSVRFLCFS